MSGLIPRHFIENLLTRVDIVELINARVSLRKAGANYKALCPFHQEKSPSFTVTPSKQIYHCFGCGKSGNAIGFLMDYDRLGFIEAVTMLAAQCGIEVPRESGGVAQQLSDSLLVHYNILAKVMDFFKTALKNTPAAQQYATKRGLTASAIDTFAIGYAPARGADLANAFRDQVSCDLLLANGLLLQSDNGEIFSRFRQRLIFPIRNRRGQVIAFGGRTLGDDQPKYLNSPETPVFHKGNELYGLCELHQSRLPVTFLIVVEGYMDVVALANSGIHNAVATMGTAITPKQVQLLLRESKEIVFCFDGDQAGVNAAWRALEAILPLMRDDLQVKFLFLPAEDDPDSYVKKHGKAGFLELLTKALPLSDYFFEKLSDNVNLERIEGRSVLVTRANSLIAKMPQGVFRELLLQRLAELAGVAVTELDRFAPTSREREKMVDAMSPAKFDFTATSKLPLALKAVHLLLQQPLLVSHAQDIEFLDGKNENHLPLLKEMLILLKKQPNLTIGAILEGWREREASWGQILSQLAVMVPLVPTDGFKKEFLGVMERLREQNLDAVIEELNKKIKQGASTLEERQELLRLIVKRQSRGATN